MLSRSEEKRMERLEAETSSIRSRLASLPAKMAVSVFSIVLNLVTLDSALSAGGNVQGTVQKWDGSTWSSTDRKITVRDYRTEGSEIASGRRCIVLRLWKAWWVISTQC